MTAKLSGPMFEPADSGAWHSVHQKTGAHYNIYHCKAADGMSALREMFPTGRANDLNFVLFSTSGTHGTYSSIEKAERTLITGTVDEDGDPSSPSVTFLLVQPRIVCLRYGNCEPETAEDIAWLKTLRDSSHQAVAGIGRPNK
jgi:hypothetical protein